MAPDPVRMKVWLQRLNDEEKREHRREFGGTLGIEVTYLNNGRDSSFIPNTTFFNRLRPEESINSIESRRYSNIAAWDSNDSRFCTQRIDPGFGNASITLPTTLWTDPTREISLSIRGGMIEFDPVKNDRYGIVRDNAPKVKEVISAEVLKAGEAQRPKMLSDPCLDWTVGLSERDLIGSTINPIPTLFPIIRAKFERPK